MTLTASPTLAASVLMLLSAVTHAVIGAIMKGRDDKLVFRGILGLTCGLIALPLTFFVSFPPPEVWIWLIVGASLHFIYQLSQVAAFNRGDMGLVYPVMRGISPALAGLFAFFILNETMSTLTLTGLFVVVLSLIGFGWQGKSAAKGWQAALGFAAVCGTLTALYTVVDAKGIRISGDRVSYLVWFFLIDGIGIAIIVAVLRGRKLQEAFKSQLSAGVLAAILSILSYGGALIALSLAPVAKLAAIRETSVIFGAVLAAVWLKESFGLRRMALASTLAFGLILMQMG